MTDGRPRNIVSYHFLITKVETATFTAFDKSDFEAIFENGDSQWNKNKKTIEFHFRFQFLRRFSAFSVTSEV